jgi:uncharacterized protein (TIGR00251 family)
MNEIEDYVRDVPDGCTLKVRVQPGAKRTAIAGVYGSELKIALNAPPVDGRANEALIAFVAENAGLPKARVSLVSGPASRSKMLRITGRSAAEIRASLSPLETA